jgi:subtilisin family serine protease
LSFDETRARFAIRCAGCWLALVVFGIVAQAQPARFVPGRVLVKFRNGVSDAQGRAVAAGLGAQSTSVIPGAGVHVLSLPAGAENALLQNLQRRPDVAFAELDRIVPPADVTPNDTYYGLEWALPRISAPAAWSVTTGSNAVIVAVVDTGVDGTHPDLAPKMVAGWNVYNNNSDASDVYGHGTEVAGTAAAASNNGAGVASICWGCWIMPVRVSDSTGAATYSNIATGLSWAADHGARVANISYIVTDSGTVTSAASYFQSRGGVVTAAAGNYAIFDSTANNPYIITVSATDSNDQLYSWSNTGNNVDLAAPGCVYTTTKGGGYSSACGTSFSAPIAAGAAALVLSVYPGLTPSQVTSQLEYTADDVGPAGWDPSYGWGRLNASRAVSGLSASPSPSPSDTTPPTVSITSPAAGATVSGTVTIQTSVWDNVGVASVSFYVDSVAIGTITSAPFNCPWNSSNNSNGTHTVTATARDAAGNSSSATISVNVKKKH